MSVGMILMGIIFGVGFGYSVQRAGFCIAHGLGEIFMGRGKRMLKMVLVIFIVSNIGFCLSGEIFPEMGLKAIGEMRGYGFYNVLAGMIFGAGMLLCGGCILGTLRQIGEGNLLYLIVMASFIPGMALVIYVINPILEQGYDVKKVVLPQLLGVGNVHVSAALVIVAVAGYCFLGRTKR